MYFITGRKVRRWERAAWNQVQKSVLPTDRSARAHSSPTHPRLSQLLLPRQSNYSGTWSSLQGTLFLHSTIQKSRGLDSAPCLEGISETADEDRTQLQDAQGQERELGEISKHKKIRSNPVPLDVEHARDDAKIFWGEGIIRQLHI